MNRAMSPAGGGAGQPERFILAGGGFLTPAHLKSFLDEKVTQYNNSSFIEDDPICIPHSFSKLQDIEISGFFAATFAWGQRKTIINKTRELMQLMDNTPHDFILNHSEKDLLPLTHFKHRTFNQTDLFYFIDFFKNYYAKHQSLEDAFAKKLNPKSKNIGEALINFQDVFFSLPQYPERTKKHVATPIRNSSCKRINMFLRWMVRDDKMGVDFGLWKRIKPSQLLCPEDIHVGRVARQLGLLSRTQSDWQATLELTHNLKKLDATDPVKYDFALFGLGVMEGFGKE
ncbi:MAG: TIGR02757 family protein [Bacteroidetes bacterium]|nr:TIGR02757 family protein [Bacteroidota bacterium]